MTQHTSPDARYLVDVTYGDERFRHLFSAAELTKYLAKNAAEAYYGGNHPDSTRLFRWDGDKLTEMRDQCTNPDTRPDSDDYLRFEHEICCPGNREQGDDEWLIEMTYTVRIDGRS